MPTNKKKNKGKKKKSSVDEFYEKALPNRHEMNPEDFLRSTANATIQQVAKMVQGSQSAEAHDKFENQFEDMMKPYEVTPDICQRIQDLPTSESIKWFIETWRDIDKHDTVFNCCIYLVNDKAPSIGKNEKELNDEDVTYRIIDSSNKLGSVIGFCLKHYSHKEESNPDIPSTDEKELVLGTIAKYILGDFTQQFLMPLPTMRPVQEKPKAIFFY